MTEKEKMQAGLIYDANYDPELCNERMMCKEQCHEYNLLRPSQLKEKNKLMRCILGKTGESFEIIAPFWCDYGCNIEIGESFFANHNLIILDEARVVFGNNVFIAPNCCFSTAGHPLDYEQRNMGLEYARPITVGDNVWFGAGVQVMPGVTIGSNTVIGAGSVVTRDIPSGVVAVGTPCRPVKKIEK